MLFSSTQNDKVCEWPLNLELSKACGLQEENITFFDKDEKVIQDGNGNFGKSADLWGKKVPKTQRQNLFSGSANQRGIFFEKGGHFVFRSHTDIIVSNIIELMKFLQSEGATPKHHQS